MPDDISGLDLSPLGDALNGVVIDGRYVLRTMIARGSMGKVYEAEQRPLSRTVAIKILDVREEQVEGEGFAERFLREASVLARLSDPNTVRIYDFGLWEGRSYLVMEFIDGQPLSHVVRRQPLPPLEAISIAMQICSSLSEAHKLGVVHRDLKLSNILVIRKDNGRWLAKVIDFGLVKDVVEDTSELTAVGQILGSPMYMAPEQIRSENIDQRVDLYALGVVLYRMLLCQRPFIQKGTPGLLFAHLNQPPRSFAEAAPGVVVPDCLEWTVMRCLEKDAAARFATAGELRRALKACRIAIEEPTLSTLTIELRDGMTLLPPELSDIASFGSIISSQSTAMPASSAPTPVKQKGPERLVMLLGVGVLLLGAALVTLIIGLILMRDPVAETVFVPIQSPTIQVDAAPEPSAAPVSAPPEPAAAPDGPSTPVMAPVPKTSRPSPRRVTAPPSAEPAPAEPAPAEPAPAELAPAEPAPASPSPEDGGDWESPGSDLVDPWAQ
ncbi:MAG: serine/threonine-protein kinase [Myxococcota bacterium]|nr:serine/threonine-protein kinase [Myxococcota bacterium]